MSSETLVFLASDHAGINLRSFLCERLQSCYNVEDLGVNSPESVDYPDIAELLVKRLQGSPASARGILICGTGIGMSMKANRVPGIRAAVCVNDYMARLSRAHNDANVLCLGARVLGTELSLSIARVFLETPFEGGRHKRRVDKIDGKDSSQC